MSFELLLLNVLYDSLVGFTAAFILVLIPFCGAYWIFKRTSKDNAESSVFQIGLEIALELQRPFEDPNPVGGIYYSYIDKHIEKIENKDRDIALSELAKELLMPFQARSILADCSDREKACLYLAIIADRFDSLTPTGITWSGRGAVFSSFGETITIDDKLFPFGTRAYRQWINRFPKLQNPIWMLVFRQGRTREYADLFAKENEFYSAERVNRWIDTVGERIEEITALHSRLITLIQTIGQNINERYFAVSLLFSAVYLVLFAISGYLLPKLLFGLDLLNIRSCSVLMVVTVLLAALMVYRLFIKSGRKGEVHELRQIFLGPLKSRLSEIRKSALRFKNHYFADALANRRHLRLPKQLRFDLDRLISVISSFNTDAQKFSDLAIPKAKEIENLFPTRDENLGGFGLGLEELAECGSKFESELQRIGTESRNFSIHYSEQHSSRNVARINLSTLDNATRERLISEVRSMASWLSGSTEYAELVDARKRLLVCVEKLERSLDKVLNKSPLDLAQWLTNL